MKLKNRVQIIFVTCAMLLWSTAAIAKKKTPPVHDPVVHHVPKTVGFPGDEIVVEGEGLNNKKLKFKVGNTKLKTVAASPESATILLPKRVKTGPLRLTVGRTQIDTDVTITVLPIPVIKKIPKIAVKGGKLRVRGKGFSEVSSWHLGAVVLQPDDAAPITDKEITLEIPMEAPDEATLVARLSGREFPAKKGLRLGVPPVISHVMYLQSDDARFAVLGYLEGTHLSAESTVKVGRKKAKTRLRNTAGTTTLEFRFKQKLPKKKFKLVAANGPFESEPYEMDGKKQGFSVAEADLKKVLFREPTPLNTLSQAHLEKEIAAIGARVEHGCAAHQTLQGKKSSPAKLAAASGKCATAMLNAMMWARYYQGTLCQRMGKKPDDAQMNAGIAKQLEKVSTLMKSIPENELAALWGKITPKMLKGGALKKMRLGTQFDLMEQVVESRHFAWITCDGRVYGPDKKSAKTLVHFDTEALFKQSFPTAFKQLWAQTTDPKKFEKQLVKPLRTAGKEMSRYWKQIILKRYVTSASGQSAGDAASPHPASAAAPIQETVDAFSTVFMAGNLERWADFYAEQVLLEQYSEFLHPKWGIVKKDTGRKAQTVSKDELMGAYGRFMKKVGVDKWQKAFGNIPKQNITVTAEGDIQQLAIRAVTVDDTMLFKFKYNAAKKKWEIVAEQTDY